MGTIKTLRSAGLHRLGFHYRRFERPFIGAIAAIALGACSAGPAVQSVVPATAPSVVATTATMSAPATPVASATAVEPTPTPTLVSLATPPPLSSRPPGSPAPAELIGTWDRIAGSSSFTPTMLILTAGAFTIRADGAVGGGNLVVNGDEIDFFNSGPCPAPVGRYQWTLKAGTLHFTPLNSDPCGRQEFLADQSYTKSN